ncbi:MAG TPA: NAD(P)H-dependent oxidoreductase [Kiritimatiellia bacterium]|nr:NAD(P)H-dependent oxidoreductase [Kiritimatiellia bacterium]
MKKTISILGFAGSTREASLNKRLIQAAARLPVPVEVTWTVVDLREVAMPLYDGDLEEKEGSPAGALALRKLIVEHDAVLLSSPEYNASVTAVLKNAIDWVSRPAKDGLGKVFANKPVGLLSASPGGLGGIRGLNHLRAILQNLGAFVIPAQFALGGAGDAFAEDGGLASEAAGKAVAGVIEQLAKTAGSLEV